MKRVLFSLLVVCMFGCAGMPIVPTDIVGQFKETDAKLTAMLRADANQEIINCNTKYDIPDVEKKQCALCGEYILYALDWKDSKLTRVDELMQMINLPPSIGDGQINIVTTTADIAYGKSVFVDPTEELKQIASEGASIGINLKNACAPLFTKAKVDAARLAIKVGAMFK